MYEPRTYRNQVQHKSLTSFNATVKETDLQIQADKNLSEKAKKAIIKYRNKIERFISKNPEFAHTLSPFPPQKEAPEIIKEMIHASERAGVGPMACVAGVIAEYVAKDLLKKTRQVIIENGGDIFMKIDDPVTIGIYSGSSPLNMRIGIKISETTLPIAICTSSGTIGHSLSLGHSDAVCVVADSGALADASATSIGNVVSSTNDINKAIEFGKRIGHIKGLVIIKNDTAGFWGDIEIVKL